MGCGMWMVMSCSFYHILVIIYIYIYTHMIHGFKYYVYIYILYTHKYTYEYMDFIGFKSPRGDLGIRGGVWSPVDLPLMYGDWVWRYTLETTPCGWDMKSPKGWRTFGVLVG